MKTVLIANDSRFARIRLRDQLVDASCFVLEADHGADVFRQLDRSPIDAMILNLTLPGIDGLRLTRALRADGWRFPILITCIDLLPAAQGELESLGAAHIRMASFNPDAVVSRLQRLQPLAPITRSA